MMSTNGAFRYVPIGQRIVIIPDDADAMQETKDQVTYSSRIEDVLDDAIVVSTPMHRRDFVTLPLNTQVSAYFNARGARYHFQAVVGGRSQSPFPVLYLTDIRSVRREERRTHARIDLSMEPIEIAVVEEGGERRPLRPRFTLVTNLSAGGIGLVSRDPLSIGDVLYVVLELPRGYGRLEVKAKVVRSAVIQTGVLQKWQVGTSFRDMDRKGRDRVAAFVLHQQQVLRRRGLR